MVIGISFVLSQRYTVGGLMIFLGLLRGAAAFRQLTRLWELEAEQREDE